MSRRVVLAAALLIGGLVGSGCGKRDEQAASKGVSATATPTPTPTPRAVFANSGRMHATLTDTKGATLAVLDADGANYDPLHPAEAISVKNADVVLYEDNKPATRLRAETVTADRVKRLLTATGNARAVSLNRKDAPTLRADRMIWHADRKLLTGSGNVLATAKPDFTLPGTSFTADTKLSRFDVLQEENDKRPATGSL